MAGGDESFFGSCGECPQGFPSPYQRTAQSTRWREGSSCCCEQGHRQTKEASAASDRLSRTNNQRPFGEERALLFKCVRELEVVDFSLKQTRADCRELERNMHAERVARAATRLSNLNRRNLLSTYDELTVSKSEASTVESIENLDLSGKR